MAERPRALAAPHARTGRWRRRRRSGATGSSPTGWTATSGSSPRATAACSSRFAVGSPIESSPIVRDGIDYFGTWNGRVYALDLRRQRAALDVPLGLQDHLVRRRSPAGRSTSATTAAGCSRSRARRGRERWAGTRQRPHLRHAGRRGRPRVRAELERRLAVGLHDRAAGCSGGATSAPTSTRRRRSGTAASSSAPTAASSTRSRRRAAARSGRSAPAARSRARPSSSTASPTRARSRTGSSASTPARGRVAARLPARRVRAGLG